MPAKRRAVRRVVAAAEVTAGDSNNTAAATTQRKGDDDEAPATTRTTAPLDEDKTMMTATAAAAAAAAAGDKDDDDTHHSAVGTSSPDDSSDDANTNDGSTSATAPVRQRGATALQDEILWGDDDAVAVDGGDDDMVILFPDAEELTGRGGNDDDAAADASVLRLGTTQHLDESDSSEDEAVLNRVGDIPLEWYADEQHMGYDIDGNKLHKRERSALERLLAATDDPNAMRTIHDALHDRDLVLSNADLQVLFNLQRNRTTNPAYNMYAEVQQDTVSFDPLNHPLARGGGPSRRHFTPSLHDMKVVAKMVRRLRREAEERRARRAQGKEDNKADNKDDEDDKDGPQLLWGDAAHVEMDTHTHFKYHNRVPKPKAPPPGTYESYRPPPEYLPSEAAVRRQARLRAIDRKEHFLPHAFDALRHVPFYHHTMQDRYQRCLDLAFFPRAQRTRLVVDPRALLPELPSAKELRPYPERLSFQYKGHTATVRSVSVSPNGQYLATACDDHLVRVYEVLTGRLMKRYDMGAPVSQVEFCPAATLNVLAVAVEYSVVFVVPTFAAHATVNEHTIRVLRAPAMTGDADAASMHAGGGVGADADVTTEAVVGPAGAGVDSRYGGALVQSVVDRDETAHRRTADLHDSEEREKRAEFVDAAASERRAGIVVKVALHAKVKRLTFHLRGDYLCVLCPKDHVKYRQTIMLQLSKRKVFCPFRKFAEVVMDCRFHPREPIFFLATTNAVRCYNLLAHKLQRRYKAPGGVTTSLSVHPSGDHFLVGDTTHHTSWYDCDYSDKPYRRMRSHKGVVNAVAFHGNTNAYPLFASAAADGQVHVFHGMVYDDYNKNALIVPVKILRHRRPVYALAWHPTLPWLFTSTEDGVVTAWTE